MTEHYEGQLFDGTNFLVFSSRVLAIILSLLISAGQKWFNSSAIKPHTVPLYLYSIGAFTNNVSTQSQYEMLKYLSFPMQAACLQLA